jgi:transcriptional regulator with XRE-family HTH domain
VSDEEGAPGARIARARRRRGLSQAVLAGLVGRSESWLSQVERGRRDIDSHSVLTRLAEVLRVDISEIAGSDGDGRGRRVFEAAGAIERAMMRYDEAAASIGGAASGEAANGEAASPGRLRDRAQSAYREYQAARYDDVGRLLPALIRAAEAAARAPGGSAPDACEARALVYDTAAALLHRVGEAALAWAAADRAMTAAEQSGRSARAAIAAWRLSHVIAGSRHPEEALALAMTAADALERVLRPEPDQLSAYGALHLAAATAASAVHDHALTASLLGKARGIAAEAGEGNRMGTAFGPANVAIHAITAALALGDARSAVDEGESLDPGALPSGCAGRRAQVSLDLARAYMMRRQDAAAVNLLLAAERVSPQLVRYDWRTREVLEGLLRREHRPSTPELRPLARRAGVI